jgi:hypothetical protein
LQKLRVQTEKSRRLSTWPCIHHYSGVRKQRSQKWRMRGKVREAGRRETESATSKLIGEEACRGGLPL